ncbi:MAG: 2-oxoacid:acceptor oxidoreductase family protein [Candidatus Aramenus sp.]|jgi:pyruvate ferredoxin oxidoreductase gamma subunit|nr:2-oxoacid:acceptor oxidoreductase family protein [Candidatus Aramenus sp.]
MIELSIKGRGGQGVVTAGELLVASSISEGYYGQSIPFYGGERRGAPVTSEVRLSKEPIFLHRRVYNPDVVAVFDAFLFSATNPLEGLKENGKVLMNSSNPRKVWRETYVVDATKIAQDIGLVIAGWAVVNTAMVGALASLLKEYVDLDALEEVVKEEFPGKLGEMNAEAVSLGYRGVKKVD